MGVNIYQKLNNMKTIQYNTFQLIRIHNIEPIKHIHKVRGTKKEKIHYTITITYSIFGIHIKRKHKRQRYKDYPETDYPRTIKWTWIEHYPEYIQKRVDTLIFKAQKEGILTKNSPLHNITLKIKQS